MKLTILSPSGAIEASMIDTAAARMRSWGWEVTIAPHAYAHHGRFAGTQEERIADFTAAWQDPTVDYILCSRGGYGLQDIADSLAPVVASKGHHPALIGFSDITVIHSLCAKVGIPTLHALMAREIATLPEGDVALKAFRAALEGELSAASIAPCLYNRTGRTTGRLIGGNLSVLYGLQGTPYSLDRVMDSLSEAPILFLEDIGEQPYHIDRMMQNLRMSGVLGRISGLVLGHFTDCPEDESMGCRLEETILQAVSAYDYPVLFHYPAGHEQPNYPLWLGRRYTLFVTPQEAELSAC